MAFKEMDGRADAIIDGGDCEIGLESTVILLDVKAVRIIRPGAVTFEMVENALYSFGHGYKLHAPVKSGKTPLSPGLKYLHYKPKAEVYLTGESDIEKIKSLFPGRKIGMILSGGGKNCKINPDPRVLCFGTLAEYAQGLYRGFTELDGMGCEIIIAQSVEPAGLGSAIMNRLIKASGGKSI
jgi:L-threonylcarbamoyladenylate synthase